MPRFLFAALLFLLPLAAQAAGDPLPAGYLSTNGNQLVTGTGQNVRLACVGYTQPTGNYNSDMSIIRSLGFNCIRSPYYDANLNLTTMDAIVSAATNNSIRVIFAHYGNEADSACLGQQSNGLWYDKNDTNGTLSNGTDGCGTNGTGQTGTVTYATFKQNWVNIASHYNGNQTVIGFDLHNEPLVSNSTRANLTWGTSTSFGSDVQAMCQDTGTAIHNVNAGALVVCEGPINYTGTLLNGTTIPSLNGLMDLSGVAAHPVTIAGKVLYSVHEMPQSVSGVNPDSGSTHITAMNQYWGYLVSGGTAPVWIGAMGASLDNSNGALADEQAWAQEMVNYTNGLLGGSGGPVFTGVQQGVGTDWMAFGNLSGQPIDGILNSDNSAKSGQQTYWSQLLYHVSNAAVTTWNPNDASSMTLSNNNLTATSVLQSGSYITAGNGSFTDNSGNVWTITTNNDLQENGASLPGDAGGGTSAAEYYNNTVYAQDATTGQWYTWDGQFFTQSSAPPTLAAAGGVRSTSGKSSGTYCAQITINTMTNHAAVGIGNATDALNGYMGGAGSSSVALNVGYTGHPIGVNGQAVAQNNSLPNGASNEVITIVVDATNRQVWFSDPQMVAGGTPWNDSGTANPTNKTGGVSISAIAPPYYLEVNTQESTTAFTVNATPSGCPAGIPTWDTNVAAGRPITVILGANQPFNGVVTPIVFSIPN